MNASNPFQVPAWAAINREQRRRERFKRTVIAIIVVTALLLVGLLIEGCKSERASMSTPAAPTSNVPVVSSLSTLPTTPPAKPVATDNQALNVRPPLNLYIVKSGDTLTRIARTYGTTVKAIEAANDLNGDRIVVGLKLKIPEA
jgi:hypothetical protein